MSSSVAWFACSLYPFRSDRFRSQLFSSLVIVSNHIRATYQTKLTSSELDRRQWTSRRRDLRLGNFREYRSAVPYLVPCYPPPTNENPDRIHMFDVGGQRSESKKWISPRSANSLSCSFLFSYVYLEPNGGVVTSFRISNKLAVVPADVHYLVPQQN